MDFILKNVTNTFNRISGLFRSSPALRYGEIHQKVFCCQVVGKGRKMLARLASSQIGKSQIIFMDGRNELKLNIDHQLQVIRTDFEVFLFRSHGQQLVIRVSQPELLALWLSRLIFQNRTAKDYQSASPTQIKALLESKPGRARVSTQTTRKICLGDYLKDLEQDLSVLFAATGQLIDPSQGHQRLLQKDIILLVKLIDQKPLIQINTPDYNLLSIEINDASIDQKHNQIIFKNLTNFAVIFDGNQAATQLKATFGRCIQTQIAYKFSEKLTLGSQKLSCLISLKQSIYLIKQGKFQNIFQGQAPFSKIKSLSNQACYSKIVKYGEGFLAKPELFNKDLHYLSSSLKLLVAIKSSKNIIDFQTKQKLIFTLSTSYVQILNSDGQILDSKKINQKYDRMLVLENIFILTHKEGTQARMLPLDFQIKSRAINLPSGQFRSTGQKLLIFSKQKCFIFSQKQLTNSSKSQFTYQYSKLPFEVHGNFTIAEVGKDIWLNYEGKSINLAKPQKTYRGGQLICAVKNEPIFLKNGLIYAL